jgi:hypothetical protein
MLILEIASRAVITSVPTEAQGRRSRPTGVTFPFVKNCTLRGKVDWERLASKWTQLAISEAPVASPMIIAGVSGWPRFHLRYGGFVRGPQRTQ